MRTAVARLVSAFLVAFVVLGSGLASPAESKESESEPRVCLVSIAASAHLDPEPGAARVQGEIAVTVLPDCSVHYGAMKKSVTRREAAGSGRSPQPLLTTYLSTCRGRNLLHGFAGPTDELTILDTYVDYWYDNSNVVARYSWNEHWSQIDGWYLHSGPYHQDYGAPPATSLRTGTSAWFNNTALSAMHEKINYVDVWYTGGCTGSFSHNGFVCGGCGVKFYIDVTNW